jgi:Gly-Xaa carboxypeptidase
MEKGHLDVWLELYVNGGHSSTPFAHTGIGIASEIIHKIESHPYTPQLIKDSPTHKHMVCQAKYSPKAAPTITKLVKQGKLTALAKELVKTDRATQYRVQTSQAVDLVTGGVKINAMPEYVKVGINHRIAPHDSISDVKAHILKQIKPSVKRYGLAVRAFEGEEGISETTGQRCPDMDIADVKTRMEYSGTIILSSSQASPVAPITPTTGPIWDVFSGTIRHSFAFDGGKVVPVGEIMPGNTDANHYQST